MFKETIISVEYSELEKIIFDEYGVTYEIMPMEEVGSSQYAATYTKNVSKGDIEDWDLEYFQSFTDGKPKKHSLDPILRDLCNKGKLEEGKYVIEVNW